MAYGSRIEKTIISRDENEFQDVTGNITAVQAVISTPVDGGTVVCDVATAANVMMFCTGTFSTINCSFEASLAKTGDANWFAIQAARSNANTIEATTGNLSAQPAYAWEVSVNGIKRIRVRCTARTSGTQSWLFVRSSYPTEPIPAIPSHAVSGTVAVTIAPVIYTDTTTNLGSGATFTGTSRDGGSTAVYRKFYATIFTDKAGTVRLERSTDNTNWFRSTSDTTAAAGAVVRLESDVTTRYNRVVHVNGADAQTSFMITSGYARV